MPNTLNKEALNRAMQAVGLNQARLAERLSVSRESVSKWFSGDSFPRPDKLLKLGMTLKLPHSELVIKDDPLAPVVAFRTVRKKKSSDQHYKKAQDMGRLLAELVPFLPFDQLEHPPTLKAPTLDYHYLQQVAKKIREDIVVGEMEVIDFKHLIKRFNELQAVLVPVLWGTKNRHENATHIYLPGSMTTWVYLNLDVNVHDFKFWIAHELGHALAPQLKGDEGEDFADALAGTLLCPESLAAKVYAEAKGKSAAVQLKKLRAAAEEHTISIVTIYRQIEAYTEAHDLESLALGETIYGANTNLNKDYPLVSETIFGTGEVDAKTYWRRAKEVFDTPFFDALSQYLRKTEKSASFVQTVLDIGLLDAKGLHAELT